MKLHFKNVTLKLIALSAISLALVGCNRGESPSNVTAPGEEEKAKTRVLEAGAAVLQSKTPIAALISTASISTAAT